jgi:formate hydrogenlyase subunit 3/multisubunit Na+/H+ antiporter MnhD subunit
MAPIAPLPALMAALANPVPVPVTLDWLLLGTELALTETARTFLAFTALLWGLAGWQAMRLLAADPARDRFLTCFLLAMTGNLGLLIAQDIAAFYAFFAMMSLASWGLVLHGGGAAQSFAGRVYITFAVAGELALFAGLAMGVFATGEARLSAMASPELPGLATALMAAGLLVKLGAVPLHLWLPLAHAAAPAPASAVLSGAMLKAGLFGLMIVLPLGTEPMPAAAAALAAMAVSGLILAPVLGMLQGDPKAVLAYSSIGQMSLMALGLAAALAAPGAWPVIAPALVLLAVAHAFAKAALFLGVPVIWTTAGGPVRAAVLALLALSALTLAGLPMTGGGIAKDALKASLSGAAPGWTIWLGTALFVASSGTACLMVRALWLLAKADQKPGVARDVVLPWVGASALGVVGIWIVPAPFFALKAMTFADVAPVAAAGGLALAALALTHWGRLRLKPMPQGEILALWSIEPARTPLLALPPPTRMGRALVVRRRKMPTAQPEYGALAMLAVVVMLALGMGLATAPTSMSAPDERVEG